MRAFSLVELSIVLVILGLLTGGVLTGQSLIHAAELRAVVSELERYRTATQSFRSTYMALPGDMHEATRFWKYRSGPDCINNTGAATDTLSGTCDGNGNGQVVHGESFLFWQHLALAGLIEGSYTGVTGPLTSEDHIIGRNAPASRLSGTGWGVFYRSSTNGTPDRMFDGLYEHSFIHGNKDPVTGWPEAASMRPEDAWNIDSKIDDGKPAQGFLFGLPWTTCTNASGQSDTNTGYRLTSTDIACVIRSVRSF